MKRVKTNLYGKVKKNDSIGLHMKVFIVSREFCESNNILIEEYIKKERGTMTKSTEKILLEFVKAQTKFNENQQEFNKNIFNEIKEIKTRLEEIANTPTMKKELSN